MSADRDESFLTVAEVAEWLKINQQTVRNWIDQGSLPAVRVGRRVRIKQSDLDRILDAGYQGGASAPPPRPSGPSAEDFWSGEPVGMAEPDPTAPTLEPPASHPEAPSAASAANGSAPPAEPDNSRVGSDDEPESP